MIIESFSGDLKLFLSEIETIGFKLCIVGGYPRDYLLLKKRGADLDFEIRPKGLVEKKDWPLFYKNLHSFLDSKKIKYKKLPYLITSVEFGDYQLEFSSPRIEVPIEDNLSHHHFEADLDPNLSYKDSFKRRDFTINAIGIELDMASNSETTIDPYEGVRDLERGILKNISGDFFNDSVRFLRLIRFQLKFNSFVVDEKLVLNLTHFNLKELSIYHFKMELFKSSPGKFLKLFKKMVLQNSMSLPESFTIWLKYDFPEDVKTEEDILAFVIIHNENDAKEVLTFFSMPEKKLRDLKSFLQSYDNVKKLDQAEIKKLISLPLESALEHNILRDLKNLEDKKEWIRYLSLKDNDLIINWDDWKTLTVVPAEISNIKLALRSYYRFYKAILGKFKNG